MGEGFERDKIRASLMRENAPSNKRMHTNRVFRFSLDTPGFLDAGFAASARFRRRSVILVVDMAASHA
jgi:hypothetical protein